MIPQDTFPQSGARAAQRHMNSNRQAQTYTLPDGRTLGYAEWGNPNGFPIMLFHGTPGSRLWFLKDDPIAHILGLRLISIDRPGFGLSDAKPRRTILDWPDDVAALATHLNLPKFSVLGISGGGAYAAACAYKIPHRLQAVGLVSTIAPFKKGKTPKGMCRENKMAFYLSRNFPWLLRLLFSSQKKMMEKNPAKYKAAIQQNVSHLCEPDQKICQTDENAELVLLQLKEALRTSVREAASEPALLSRDWGFTLGQIRMPVLLWHGVQDTLSPIEAIKEAVAALHHITPHYLAESGHFVEDDVWREILVALSK